MASSVNLSGWAGEIIEDMELSGVTTGSVVSWLGNNLGNLNNLLGSEYEYVSGDISGAILPEMETGPIDIYEKMYECQYLSKKARQAATLGFSDWIQIDGDDQGSIRKVSKTEVAKELRGQAKDCKLELEDLVNVYNASQSGALPNQVIGVTDCCYVEPC